MAERYSLKPYQSTYVNRKSAEINDVLRQRYEQAFNTDDAIAGAVDEMDAAGFAGDQALKKELADSTREELEQRASRGDYETMGMDVARSARNFQKEYSPLKQNYDALQAYQKKLEEAYKIGAGKPGGIDVETYRNAMRKSVHGYDGIQRNEDGSIDESSMFSGYSFVDDVNIDELVEEYMENYVANEGEHIETRVGQLRRNEKGEIIDDPAGTQYRIKTKEGYKYITDAEVAEAYNRVTSRPEVQAYLQQKADLRTFDLSDEDLQANLMYDLDGDMSDPNNEGGLRGALEEAVEKGKTTEAEALQKVIDEKEALLRGTGIETPEEMAELRRKNARKEVMEGEIYRGQASAINKFGFQNVYTEYAEEYDKKWMQEQKAALDYEFIPNLLTKSGMTQIKNPGGNNVKDITSYMENQDVAIDSSLKDLNGLLGGTDYTFEQIMSGKDAAGNDIKLPDGMSENIFTDRKDQLRYLAGEKAIQERLLREAKEATGYLQGVDNVLASTYGDKTGQQMLDFYKNLFNMPNSSNEQIVDKIVQVDAYDDLLTESEGLGPGEARPDLEELRSAMVQAGGQRARVNMIKDLSPGSAKLDAWLEKNAQITVGGMASTVFPGLDPKAADKNTKAIKSALVKKPLDKNFEIFYDGQKQDGTGTVASLIEDNGWAGTDVIINDIKFHTQAFLGEPSLEVQVKGKDKDGNDVYKNVIMPYSNIKNQGLDEYFNDPSYKVAMEVNRARNVGLPDTKIRFSNGSSFEFLGLDGKGKEIIQARDKDGNLLNTFDKNSTIKLKDGREVKMLDYFIQEASAEGQSFYTDIDY